GTLGGTQVAVARLGTGEFVVVRRLTEPRDEITDIEALDDLEHDIQAAVRRLRLKDQPLPRVSMGMAIGDLAVLRQPWTLVLTAFDLCREARRRGGNSTLREGQGLGRRL